jgi:phenylpropionate dioxygenase-like ring-hydroxylating dioxygenase large terminal subunit
MINDPVLVNDWHPVATVEELNGQNILAAELLAEDIVLWRANGQTLAWQDLCIHRGTRLSLGQVVEGDQLECPYHGWTYNTAGKCVRIPAHPEQTPPQKARVKTYRVIERYGLIWVSLGDPEHDIPPFPEWDDDRFYKVIWGPKHVQASGPRIIENFLDVAHLPFVHEGILGDSNRPEIGDYKVKTGAGGVISSRIEVYQPSPYGDQGGTVFYTYSAFRPLTAHFLKESENLNYAILLVVTPQEETLSTARAIIATTRTNDATDEQLRARLDEIFGQDQPVVEAQRPELLPLDLQAELHLRSDRMAIDYRKWLNELGLTFGVA